MPFFNTFNLVIKTDVLGTVTDVEYGGGYNNDVIRTLVLKIAVSYLKNILVGNPSVVYQALCSNSQICQLHNTTSHLLTSKWPLRKS
jgi:hypothetical protein